MLILIIILVAVVVFICATKVFRLNVDKVVLITGGSGSGKTLFLTSLALKKYRLAWRRWYFRHLFSKSLKEPRLVSNYPIYINHKKGFSERLTLDILASKDLLPDYSVVVMSELNKVASQWDYSNNFIKDYFNPFVSQGRHYFNGYILADDQSAQNVCNVYTRSSGSYLYTFGLKRFNLGLFTIICHKVFSIPSIEEIAMSNVMNYVQEAKSRFYVIPFWVKHYESRFMKRFYGKVPEMASGSHWQSFYCDYQINIPSNAKSSRKEV